MTSRVAIRKLKLRLNKLDSSDYDNIPLPDAVEAINKAALDWFRRQVHGDNQQKEGDEESRMRVDDLQRFLKPTSLTGINNHLYFETETFPEDYLYYKRIIPNVYTKTCEKKFFKSHLAEEANVPDFLTDENWKPSFKWEHCFHTLVGNKIRLYTNKDFSVKNIDLLYYRRPFKMDIKGYKHENGTDSKDVDLEFKDDIAELIIGDAASIIAGDIESINASQINSQRTENNN